MTSQKLSWKINTDQGRPGIHHLKGRWFNSLIEWRIEWSVFCMKTIKVAFPRPHPAGTLLFVIGPPSLGGKSLKYRARVTIINRSNYSYHFYYHFNFPCLFLCVGWYVCYSYESYFSQIKQLQRNKGGLGLNPGRSPPIRAHYGPYVRVNGEVEDGNRK